MNVRPTATQGWEMDGKAIQKLHYLLKSMSLQVTGTLSCCVQNTITLLIGKKHMFIGETYHMRIICRSW